MAEKLELAIKDHDTHEKIDLLLERLKRLLETLILQLEWQLSEKAEVPVETINLQQLKAVCNALEILLIDDDAEAVDLLAENTQLLNAAFPTHYHRLQDSIRLFDFESALATLRAATETVT
jgi:two-component system sensor histidine kinase/response regulator